MCWFVALGTALGASGTSAAAVGAMATATAATTAMSAYSQYQTGKFNEKVAKTNAEIQGAAALDAAERGADDAARVKQRARMIAGAQRAGAAGSGVEIDTGSPLDLLTETAGFGELDAEMTRSNAQRQAYGFGVAGMNQRSQGRLSRYQGNTGAAGTIMTGASQAYSYGLMASRPSGKE